MSSPNQCSIPCDLCGGTEVQVLATRGRHNTSLRTVMCRGCGLVWTDPRPSADETRNFYSDQYRQLYKATFRPRKKHVYREMKRAIERFRRIRPLLGRGMKLLDIGAGGGFFPYVLGHNGFEITGLEPNRGYAKYANEEFQLDILNCFLQDADFENGSFDMITLNHVLEHLDAPFAALVRIFEWLKPGGYLNIEVPNIEARFHAPRNRFHLAHLYTFNPENLRLMGVKAGFTVEDIKVMPGTGHVNVIFSRQDDRPQELNYRHGCEIPGNFEHIKNKLDSHTSLSHYLSVTPYIRFVRKMLGYFKEQIVVSRFKTGRDIADYLLAKEMG